MKIFLKIQDECFEIEKETAYLCSNLLKNLIDDQDEDEDDDIIFPIQELNQNGDCISDKEAVKKVIEFCNYYVNNQHPKLDTALSERPIKSSNKIDLHKYIEPWFADFVNFIELKDFKGSENSEKLNRILLTADLLEIIPLFELCCLKYASVIKGYTNDEIRKVFAN